MSEEQDNQENSTAGDSLLQKNDEAKAVEMKTVPPTLPPSSISISEPKAEVKYTSPDSQNGDAKIDLENVRAAFAGMAKEELMRFANDPFWVRTRWILFSLFWLLWLAMLTGAIAIIVLAPKCSAPKPREWYEQSPLYEVNVRSFKDGSRMADGIGDLEGMRSKLDYIKALGVRGVILSSIFPTGVATSPESVEDFMAIHHDIGTLEEFKELVAAMKERDLHVILDLVPNHSSMRHKWFQESIKKIPPYKDYYMWAPGKGFDADENKNKPPNNWTSVVGGPAWEWNEARGEFYLHQFAVDQPDLNFRNPAVVDEFKNIIKFWLGLGVSGFQMRKTAFLIEDAKLRDEEISNKPVNHESYDFWTHKHTAHLPDSLGLVGKWRAIVCNETQNNILLVDDEFPIGNFAQMEEAANITAAAKDVLQTPQFPRSLAQNFNTPDLLKRIHTAIENSPHNWPVWRLGGEGLSRLASRFTPGLVDAMTMVTMLLPGTPVIFYGDEIGMKDVPGSATALGPMQWNSSTHGGFTSDSIQPWVQLNNPSQINVASQLDVPASQLEIVRELVDARKTLVAVMLGRTNVTLLNVTVTNGTAENNPNISGSVFAFTRIKNGNPGVLVAVNPTNVECAVNFSTIPDVAEELTVHVRSRNFIDKDLEVRNKIPRDSVKLPPESAIMFTFVYKEK